MGCSGSAAAGAAGAGASHPWGKRQRSAAQPGHVTPAGRQAGRYELRLAAAGLILQQASPLQLLHHQPRRACNRCKQSGRLHPWCFDWYLGFKPGRRLLVGAAASSPRARLERLDAPSECQLLKPPKPRRVYSIRRHSRSRQEQHGISSGLQVRAPKPPTHLSRSAVPGAPFKLLQGTAASQSETCRGLQGWGATVWQRAGGHLPRTCGPPRDSWHGW
jgi:hypothetical protein